MDGNRENCPEFRNYYVILYALQTMSAHDADNEIKIEKIKNIHFSKLNSIARITNQLCNQWNFHSKSETVESCCILIDLLLLKRSFYLGGLLPFATQNHVAMSQVDTTWYDNLNRIEM